MLSLAEAILNETLSEKEPKLSQAFGLRKGAVLQLYTLLKQTEQRSILDSLIHMHCNRLFGIDPKLESKARAHALHILSSLQQKRRSTLCQKF